MSRKAWDTSVREDAAMQHQRHGFGSVNVPGEIQDDGTFLLRVDTPPGSGTVEVAGSVWPVPPGAVAMSIRISTSDSGVTRITGRAVYEGDTTT
jgi:hypothetical protein